MNKNSELTWEKPAIQKIVLTQVTKGGQIKGNDGGGQETGRAASATS